MIKEVDRTIHEPARLLLLIYLFSVEKADFTFLRQQTGMTQGNLSSHLAKLESAGYIHTEKRFRNNRPLTLIRISEAGKEAFVEHVRKMYSYYRDLNELVG
jgi:DNA-binding MarR family transcriptional regulator